MVCTTNDDELIADDMALEHDKCSSFAEFSSRVKLAGLQKSLHIPDVNNCAFKLNDCCIAQYLKRQFREFFLLAYIAWVEVRLAAKEQIGLCMNKCYNARLTIFSAPEDKIT